MDNIKECLVKQCKGMEASNEEFVSGISSMTSDYLLMLRSYLGNSNLPDKIFVIETCPELER